MATPDSYPLRDDTIDGFKNVLTASPPSLSRISAASSSTLINEAEDGSSCRWVEVIEGSTTEPTLSRHTCRAIYSTFAKERRQYPAPTELVRDDVDRRPTPASSTHCCSTTSTRASRSRQTTRSPIFHSSPAHGPNSSTWWPLHSYNSNSSGQR